jgi:hypothetical protein
MQILTRGSCLSAWITQLYFGEDFPKHEYFNQQTVRVDLLFDILDKKIKPMPFSMLKEWVIRPDRLGVYSQTENMGWFKATDPKVMIMDNYSEIVDKRFEHWQGYGFCGMYGDLSKEALERELAHKGMLAPERIHDLYERLFQFIKDKWNIPIIYVHFPTVLDPREEYKAQGNEILKVMEVLAPKFNIQNITADDDSIQQIDGDNYHFGPRTVKNMTDKIRPFL